MDFPAPLIPARLLRRYKRFLADAELASGETVTAHCPNPGSMLGLADPDLRVWLLPAQNPKRKLGYSWELVELGKADDRDRLLVGINTGRPNTVVAEAISDGALPELAGYGRLRREVRYGTNSRIDILLEDDGREPCYVEVKNVHLVRRAGVAEFPDSVTARGAKHLVELAKVREGGARAVMVYLVQRGDCARLEIAADIDPGYDRALRTAVDRGVETLCYSCKITETGIRLDRALPLAL